MSNYDIRGTKVPDEIDGNHCYYMTVIDDYLQLFDIKIID